MAFTDTVVLGCKRKWVVTYLEDGPGVARRDRGAGGGDRGGRWRRDMVRRQRFRHCLQRRPHRRRHL